MKALIISTVFLLFAGCAKADVNRLFEDYIWEKRLVLVFAPTMSSADYQTQMNTLNTALTDLKDRDIVTWEFIDKERVAVNAVIKPHLSTNPFYKAYDIDHNAFAFILIGKDGEIKHQSNEPVSTDTLFSIIDAMPMRIREMNSAN